MKVPLLPVIWLIFAVLFGYLAWSHYTEADSAIPPFVLTERPDADMGSVGVLGADVDQLIADFVKDFNKYLTEQNAKSKETHLLAAAGYFLAALTALVSMGLAWPRREAGGPC